MGRFDFVTSYTGVEVDVFIFYLAQQPPLGQGLLIHEVSRPHTTTPPQSVAVAYRGGGLGVFNPPRNSEVLTKLSRIPSSVENTSVTT